MAMAPVENFFEKEKKEKTNKGRNNREKTGIIFINFRKKMDEGIAQKAADSKTDEKKSEGFETKEIEGNEKQADKRNKTNYNGGKKGRNKRRHGKV